MRKDALELKEMNLDFESPKTMNFGLKEKEIDEQKGMLMF